MKEGIAAVELDVQTYELRMRGTSLRALDTAIAGDRDMKHLFGSRTGTMQCIVDGSYEHMEARFLVGVGYTVNQWTPDDGLRDMYEEFDREYDPNEFHAEEEWIGELFEPIRQAWFKPPAAAEEVPFFLPEQPYPASTDVALVCASHPKRGKLWMEAYVYRTLKQVHVYVVQSHGRRFYRSLLYTSDARLCLRELQPSIDNRRSPWPTASTSVGPWQWGRHEAFDETFPNCLQQLTPPSHPASVVISRPIADPFFKGSADYAEELQLVDSLMFPLRTALAAVVDVLSAIGAAVDSRGAVEPDMTARAVTDVEALAQALAKTQAAEYFLELDDEDESSVSWEREAGVARRNEPLVCGLWHKRKPVLFRFRLANHPSAMPFLHTQPPPRLLSRYHRPASEASAPAPCTARRWKISSRCRVLPTTSSRASSLDATWRTRRSTPSSTMSTR